MTYRPAQIATIWAYFSSSSLLSVFNVNDQSACIILHPACVCVTVIVCVAACVQET